MEGMVGVSVNFCTSSFVSWILQAAHNDFRYPMNVKRVCLRYGTGNGGAQRRTEFHTCSAAPWGDCLPKDNSFVSEGVYKVGKNTGSGISTIFTNGLLLLRAST